MHNIIDNSELPPRRESNKVAEFLSFKPVILGRFKVQVSVSRGMFMVTFWDPQVSINDMIDGGMFFTCNEQKAKDFLNGLENKK